MLTIEDQIALIADAAMERSRVDSVVVASDESRSTRGRPLLAVAASLLVVMVVVGLVLTVDHRSDSTPVDQPDPSNAPTVTYPVDHQVWFVPALLPEGWVFDRAEDRGELGFDLRYRSNARYRSSVIEATITIVTGLPTVTPLSGDTHDVDIDGVTWQSIAIDPAVASTAWRGSVDDVPLLVQGVGVDEPTMREVVASIEQREATALPRPPIPVGGFPTGTEVEVATTKQAGNVEHLFVDTDGESFVFRSDGGSGSSVRLGDAALVSSGAMGPLPSLVSDGQESESLIWGLVRSDVASIDVELTDGRVIHAKPQDESDRFVENFYYIAVPTHTEGGLELVSAIVARDQSGTEVARLTGALG